MGVFVLDKKEIEIIKSQLYKLCPLDFIKEMIVSIYGEESKTYAERFQIPDVIAIKYKMVILDNENYIKDKNVADVGCNNGLWPVLFALHGAKSVTGIEPRPLLVHGAKKFIHKYNLPIKIYLANHKTALPILEKNNTESLVLMNMDDMIPNFEEFIYNCSTTNIKNFILQCSTISDECLQNINDPIAGFTIHQQSHNTCLRSGFNPHTEITDGNGFQTKLDDSFDLNKTAYIRDFRSEKYMQYILSQNGFRILSNKKPKINLAQLVPYRLNLHDSFTYHWFTVTKS